MTSSQPTPFGDLLRRLRKAADLTQEELAERAGLSQRGINDLERGARQSPHKDTALQLADALGLSGDDRAAFLTIARRSRASDASVADTSLDRSPGASLGASLAKTSHDADVAPPLPTGTVTFLFSDIEGSTKLLQRLGAASYAQALTESQALLRAIWRAHGGAEVDTAGDGFFVAFATAPEAVAAAADATRALARRRWLGNSAIAVRIGLHTGAPLLMGDHYIGLDVHRAARIAAVGHGGQILVSQTTRDLCEGAPEALAGARFIPLGAQRLKDLRQPEALYQFIPPDAWGLPADFPPLRTLDRHKHNLPVQLTALIGREREVATTSALLRGEARLVTLTGPAGVGKTRLALQIGAELVETFADGVWFVRLSMLTDPALLLPTIAATLGLSAMGGRRIEDVLRDWLREREALLILDNLEQLLPGVAPALAGLLADCLGLRLLVTSRVPVRLRGERETPIAPLETPRLGQRGSSRIPSAQSRAALLEAPATTLFLQRAQDAWPQFAVTETTAEAVAGICAQLDGLPLALELAARWVKLLPPPALLQRLERSLPTLTSGAHDLEARQRTMRATLDWSDALLTPAERRIFHRLATFVGGWTLEAAEALCADLRDVGVVDTLAALVDHSLVLSQPELTGAGQDEARFRMLNVIRDYALERLEADDRDGVASQAALQRAHAAYYLAYAERMQSAGDSTPPGWHERMEWDLENFRAALGWARERAEVDMGLRLASALSELWDVRVSEGRAWVEGFLGSAMAGDGGWKPEVPSTTVAKALQFAGQAAVWNDDSASALAFAERLLALAHDTRDTLSMARAIDIQATASFLRDAFETATPLIEESQRLYLEAGNEVAAAWMAKYLGESLMYQGDLERAEALIAEALEIGRRHSNLGLTSMSLDNLGDIALRRGDTMRAEFLGREALSVSRAQVKLATAAHLALLTAVASAAGHALQAARLHGAEMALRETIGFPRPQGEQAAMNCWLAGAQAALGAEGWAAAVAAGRALSLEEAIREALGQP
jgi:predicted ATPase/class 3 adenylate cyclase